MCLAAAQRYAWNLACTLKVIIILVAMLCIHDLTGAGASLREIADLLLSDVPEHWRTS